MVHGGTYNLPLVERQLTWRSTLLPSVAEEHLHTEAFGSAYCVFKSKNGSLFRLVWDGKKGYGFLQTAKSPALWEDIGPYVSGVSNPSSSKFAKLLSIAQGLVHGNVSV